MNPTYSLSRSVQRIVRGHLSRHREYAAVMSTIVGERVVDFKLAWRSNRKHATVFILRASAERALARAIAAGYNMGGIEILESSPRRAFKVKR